MEDNNNEEKNNSDMTNNIKNECNIMKANNLTKIAGIFTIIIPTIIIFIYIFSNYNIMVWTVGFKFIIPISAIIGITLLAYIRIHLPDSYWSLQLIKICVLLYSIAFCIIGLVIECIRYLSNCKMPG